MAIQIDTAQREIVLVEDAHIRPMMGNQVLESLPSRHIPYSMVDPFILVHEAVVKMTPDQASEDAADVDVFVGWVAATAPQAAVLVADVLATYQQAERLPGLGDEAYQLGTPTGPVVVRVGRAIVMVRAEQTPGAATGLARAAVPRLRCDGF